MQAGLDSLGGVELRNSIAATFAIDVPPTLAFDYPTATALAEYVFSRLVRTTSSVMTRDVVSHQQRPLALATQLIGVGCKYPGSSDGARLCSLTQAA